MNLSELGKQQEGSRNGKNRKNRKEGEGKKDKKNTLGKILGNKAKKIDVLHWNSIRKKRQKKYPRINFLGYIGKC